MDALKYRYDVDGLRFFAVLIVIMDHFDLWFHGGYIGVDVFYVISGYVITRQIANQIRNGEFSLREFWVRRFWRLGPALLLMLIVVAVVFTLLLSPTELVVFYKNTLANIVYLSNVFIWREYGGYFSSVAKEAPLLHTWSISVEEQFYVVWPLLVIILYKIKSRVIFVASIATLFVFSLLFSEFGTQHTIAAAYYLLPTRFFELLMGCVVALFAIDDYGTSWKKTRHLLSIVAAFVLVGSAVLFKDITPMPGFYALIPTIGAVLYLCSGGGVINQILTRKSIVFGGKLSYSLYLWHWPVAVAIFYTGFEGAFNISIGIIFVFFVSYLSYTFVETPLRQLKASSTRKIAFCVFAILMLCLVLFAVVGINSKGFEGRYSDENLVSLRAVGTHPNSNGCLSTGREWDSSFDSDCVFGDGATKVLLIGDSHANHFSPFVRTLLKNKGYSLFEYTMDSCNPVFDLNFNVDGKVHKAETCYKRNNLVKQFIVDIEPDVVVLGANWPNFRKSSFDENEGSVDLFMARLETTVEFIHSNGATAVVLREIPGVGELQYNCPVKNIVLGRNDTCVARVERNAYMDRALRALIEDSGVIEIDVRPLICTDSLCNLSIDGVPLYRDGSHLNSIGSELLGLKYFNEFGNPIRLGRN